MEAEASMRRKANGIHICKGAHLLTLEIRTKRSSYLMKSHKQKVSKPSNLQAEMIRQDSKLSPTIEEN